MRLSSSLLRAAALLVTLPFAATAVAVAPERLELRTTEDLVAVCSAPESSPPQLACTGFIKATVQYHDSVSDRKNLKRLVCYPNGTTVEDGRQAFVTWAAANNGNAEWMGELPVIGLVRALAAAYPCP